MAQSHHNPAGLKRGGSDCDLTIYSKDFSEFQVHKDLLCRQSAFFKTLCDGDWKENQEAKVVLGDAETDVIDVMIDYVYTGKLNTAQYHKGCKCPNPHPQTDPVTNLSTQNIPSQNNQCPTHQAGWNLDHNVRVYRLADYLCIDQLKQLAFQRCAGFLKHITSTESLTIPIANILCNTESTDILRMEALWYCVSHMWRPLSGNAAIEALLQQEEPVAYALLGRQKRVFDEAFNTKEAARLKAKTQRDEARDQLNVLQQRLQNNRSSDQRAIGRLENDLDNAYNRMKEIKLNEGDMNRERIQLIKSEAIAQERSRLQLAKINDLETELAKVRTELRELQQSK